MSHNQCCFAIVNHVIRRNITNLLSRNRSNNATYISHESNINVEEIDQVAVGEINEINHEAANYDIVLKSGTIMSLQAQCDELSKINNMATQTSHEEKNNLEWDETDYVKDEYSLIHFELDEAKEEISYMKLEMDLVNGIKDQLQTVVEIQDSEIDKLRRELKATQIALEDVFEKVYLINQMIIETEDQTDKVPPLQKNIFKEIRKLLNNEQIVTENGGDNKTKIISGKATEPEIII